MTIDARLLYAAKALRSAQRDYMRGDETYVSDRARELDAAIESAERRMKLPALDQVYEHRYYKLAAAVEDLYFAAYWHADRPVPETSLWLAVRDAAGIPGGQTRAVLGPKRDTTLDKAALLQVVCSLLNDVAERPDRLDAAIAQATLVFHGWEMRRRSE